MYCKALPVLVVFMVFATSIQEQTIPMMLVCFGSSFISLGIHLCGEYLQAALLVQTYLQLLELHLPILHTKSSRLMYNKPRRCS